MVLTRYFIFSNNNFYSNLFTSKIKLPLFFSQLIISFETKKLTLQSIQNDDVNGVDDLLFVILESLGNAFPGIPNGYSFSNFIEIS